MAEKLIPMKHKTLGALYKAGLHLYAFCNNRDCGWHAPLDLAQLIDRLGERQSALQPDLVPRLVCSHCGGKDIAIVLSAGTDISERTAEHMRAKARQKEEE